MARGEKDTSTSRVGCRRLAPRELSTASSLVTAMYVEELRFFCQAPADISMELSDDATVSTVGWADNSVYFTRGAVCCGTSLSHMVIGETVPALCPGTSCSHTSDCILDSYRLQCAELSLPIRYLPGRDLFHLHFEAWD